jgi:hypothetical protein
MRGWKWKFNKCLNKKKEKIYKMKSKFNAMSVVLMVAIKRFFKLHPLNKFIWVLRFKKINKICLGSLGVSVLLKVQVWVGKLKIWWRSIIWLKNNLSKLSRAIHNIIGKKVKSYLSIRKKNSTYKIQG